MLSDQERQTHVTAVQAVPSGTPMDRRTVLALGIAGLAGIVGYGLGARSPTQPAATSQTTAQATSSSTNPVLSLRGFKPFDLDTAWLSFGSIATYPDGSFQYWNVWQVPAGEPLTVPVEHAHWLFVAVPASIAPISAVAIEGTEPPVPILERLRDMGVPADLDELKAEGQHPSVGDLWVLVPRSTPWQPGHYSIHVAAKTPFASTITIAPRGEP